MADEENVFRLRALARLRASEGQAQQSPEMAAGLAELSRMTREPQVAERPAIVTPEMAATAIEGQRRMGADLATLLNMAGESMTFGLVGDEAAARADSLIGRGTYDERLQHYRGEEARMRQEAPVAATAAEVGGALAIPGAVFRAGGNLALRAGRAAGLGAAGGATYGFMEGEGTAQDRADGAARGAVIGGALGLAVPVLGAAARRLVERARNNRLLRSAAREAPDTEALRTAGRAAYQEVDDAGVQITPQAFDRLRGQLRDVARGAGVDELPGPGSLTPNSARALQIGDEMAAGMATDETAALPFGALDQYRRQMGAAAGHVANRQDSAIGTQMIIATDDFVRNLMPDDVTTGDIDALQSAIPKAREIWARLSRTQRVDDAIEMGQNYVSGETSGIRNQFARLLRDRRAIRGFSENEIKMLRRVVNGSVPERLVHMMGGYFGNLSSIIAGGAVGNAGGGPYAGLAGAALGGAVGQSFRRASEFIARQNAETARRVVASGRANRRVRVGPEEQARLEGIVRQMLRPVTQQLQGTGSAQ